MADPFSAVTGLPSTWGEDRGSLGYCGVAGARHHPGQASAPRTYPAAREEEVTAEEEVAFQRAPSACRALAFTPVQPDQPLLPSPCKPCAAAGRS